MQLTPEQEEFRAVVRDFALQRIAPHAETWDREHASPPTWSSRWAGWACSD